MHIPILKKVEFGNILHLNYHPFTFLMDYNQNNNTWRVIVHKLTPFRNMLENSNQKEMVKHFQAEKSVLNQKYPSTKNKKTLYSIYIHYIEYPQWKIEES